MSQASIQATSIEYFSKVSIFAHLLGHTRLIQWLRVIYNSIHSVF